MTAAMLLRRKFIAAAAFVLLWVSAPLLSAIRYSDIGRLVDPAGWTTGIITALLMGSWGWVVLILSKKLSKYQAGRQLIGLAIVHFALALLVLGDVILTGNSTAGIALLIFPALMTPVIIITAAIIVFSGRQLAQPYD
jgi:hypothetical protein